MQFIERVQWYRLDLWLRALPQTIVDSDPELLLLQAWSRENCGLVSEVSPLIEQARSLLENSSLEESTQQRVHAEVDALRSALYYMAGDGISALPPAKRAHVLPQGFTLFYPTAFRNPSDVNFTTIGDIIGSVKRVHRALDAVS